MVDQTIDGGVARQGPANYALSFERMAIAAAFLALCVLSYTRNVNWDEFYFLSHVHAWLDGRLDRPMQTGFVHAFTWLGLVPGHEMEQIFAARVVMIGCLAATSFSIHRIAHHLTNERSANVAVLAFLCSGFVLAHGGSFRADPIAAALLTSAVAVAMTTRLALLHIVAVGALLALSFMVTIKSALYLPAFLGVMIWRMNDRAAVVRLCVAMVVASGLVVLFYTWHASGVTVADGNEASTNAKDAVKTGFLQDGLFPRQYVIRSWVLFSLPQLILAAIGFVSLGRSRLVLTLCLFAAPVLSVAIYRNAFPYFFPFAAPLLMIAVAIGAQRIKSPKVMVQLGILMIFGAILQLALIAPENSRSQRATIAEVHRLFDKPISYIDGFGIMSSFPKTAFFMSSWGVARYRAAGQPVFAGIIQNEQPPLLLAQRYALQNALMGEVESDTPFDLLPEDRAVLRRSYVHYSGTIWLAGAETVLSETGAQISVPFEGHYRVETEGTVTINGAGYNDGDVISVDNLDLQVKGTAGTRLRFIWDTGVAPIPSGALGTVIYAGFGRLML
ncbi:hypothetical protein N9L47_01885 [Rhodobacteraceae bacterium]|nr:hypothetical protein [Paracoccaceae bacterium]